MASRSPALAALVLAPPLVLAFLACGAAPSALSPGPASTAAQAPPAAEAPDDTSDTSEESEEAPELAATTAAPDTADTAGARPSPADDDLDAGAPDDGGADGGKGKRGRPKLPVSSVTIGSFTVARGRVYGAAHAVGAMAADFRRCVDKALRADATSVKDGATVEIRARLDDDGKVQYASRTVVGDLANTAVECIVARVSSTEFSPPVGRYVRITIPVTVHVAP